MGDWNVENTRQMIDRKLDQGYSSTHPDRYNLLGSLDNHSHHYSYPGMHPYAMNVKDQNQLGSTQFCHPDPNYDLNAAATIEKHNADSHIPYISPSNGDFLSPPSNGFANQIAWDPSVTGVTANHQFSQPTPVDIGGTTNEHSGNYESPGYRVAHKRKYPEIDTGDYYIANMPNNPDSSSSSSRFLQHEEPNENGYYAEEQHLRSNNHIGQIFHPSSYGWAGRHANYPHVGGCDSWNYMNPVSHVNGTLDSMIVHMQEYKEAFTYGNPAFVLQPLPFSNNHQHLPIMQSVQTQMIPYWSLASNLQVSNAHSSVGNPNSSVLHSQDQNFQAIAPYHYPVNNLQPSDVHLVVDNATSVNRSSRPSQFIAEEADQSLPEAGEEYEDDFESGSDSDEHSDMRLDIEDMSYEELLALEQEMGNVSTGLSEDTILKFLKTSMCAPLALSLSSSSLLDERCVICLEGYVEHERIGTVDCGHSYHADCIKQWLLIKNICPICRMRALASG